MFNLNDIEREACVNICYLGYCGFISYAVVKMKFSTSLLGFFKAFWD